jgi:RimJ/RimL family protein N-acetyltransferase
VTALSLDTPSLRLVLESTEAVLARVDAMPASDRAEVSPEWIARIRNAPEPSPWTHGFAMVEKATGADVGSCAFKARPDAEGMVEIAYGVSEAYRGRGYAKEAAVALVSYALNEGSVTFVRAHTKPDNEASSRVLVAAGFERLGEVIDPEDGLVWRWERRPP